MLKLLEDEQTAENERQQKFNRASKDQKFRLEK